MSDWMEIGDSGLIPVEDGKYLDTENHEVLDEDGEVVSTEEEWRDGQTSQDG